MRRGTGDVSARELPVKRLQIQKKRLAVPWVAISRRCTTESICCPPPTQCGNHTLPSVLYLTFTNGGSCPLAGSYPMTRNGSVFNSAEICMWNRFAANQNPPSGNFGFSRPGVIVDGTGLQIPGGLGMYPGSDEVAIIMGNASSIFGSNIAGLGPNQRRFGGEVQVITSLAVLWSCLFYADFDLDTLQPIDNGGASCTFYDPISGDIAVDCGSITVQVTT